MMEMYKKIKNLADEGYSLIELVASIGLLMLLTSVVGVASYNTVQSKQTKEAVRLATQSAYNKALAAITDYDNDKNKVDKALAEPAKEAALQGITFEYLPIDETPTKDSLCVIGRIKGDVNDEYTYKIGPDICKKESKGLPPAEDQTLPDYTDGNVVDDTTKILYTCTGTGTRDSRLNIVNPSEGTRATLFGSDDSIVPVTFSKEAASGSLIKYRDDKIPESDDKVTEVSDTFKIKNGVQYELIVKGKFSAIATLTHGSSGTTLDMTDCMTEIVKLGADNGVTEISSYGATKFTKMSEVNLPKSVTSLRYMFDSAPINDAKVSSLKTDEVEDMKGMFYGASAFNRSLAKWNTAKVKNMSSMFENATSFNQSLAAWDVPIVEDMSAMFKNATKFNNVIPSNSLIAKDMSSMFENATSFNQDLSNTASIKRINTSEVLNMSAMFKDATSFNGKVTGWSTGKVTDMSFMFQNTPKFNSLLNWNVSSVTTMESMFEGATSFNNYVGSPGDTVGIYTDLFWDTSSVVNMSKMFKDATSFNALLWDDKTNSAWNVSKVEDMSFMFYNATSYTRDIGEWDISKVTTMESMFEGAAKFNGDITKWKTTSRLKSTKNMFKDAVVFDQILLVNINASGYWATYGLEDASGMFQNAKAFNNGNVYGLGENDLTMNTTSLKDTSSMFKGATSLDAELFSPQKFAKVRYFQSMFEGATKFNNGGHTLDVTPNAAIDMSNMFRSAKAFDQKVGQTKWASPNLETIAGMFYGASSYDKDVTAFDTSNVNDMSYMFRSASKFNREVTSFNTSKVTNMEHMFYGASIFNNGVATNSGGSPLTWDTKEVTKMNHMFYKTRFNQNMTGSWAKVTSTRGMFYGNTWVNANLEGMNGLNKITDMGAMFEGATNFKVASPSTWNTSNAVDMSRMFKGAVTFNANINKWDVSSATNMSEMFSGASVFNRDINYWDVSGVTDMKGMFSYTDNFDSNLYRWDTSKVTDMSFMFANAIAYDEPLINNGSTYRWDTSSVTTMESMFEGATIFNNRDGSTWGIEWNTSNVTNMKNMFQYAKAFNRDLNIFDTINVTDMSYMFNGSGFNNSVTTNAGGNPISWNTSKVTDMSYMFSNVNFNQHFYSSMENVTTTKGMFNNNPWLNGADFSGLRQANSITDMSYMYAGATNYKSTATRAPNYYTNNVKRFEHMFNGAVLFQQDLSGWNTGSMTHYSSFAKNSGLTAAKLPPRFNASSSGL